MKKIVFSALILNSISFSFQKLEFGKMQNITTISRNPPYPRILLADIPGYYLTINPLERNLM